METIIHTSCIKHVYPDKTEVALCGLDFIVKQNERVAILGPSGAGKTTLIRHILGLLTPTDGHIEVFGVNPSREFAKIRHRIGFVMQDVDEQLTQPTVFDEIAFSTRNFGHTEEEVVKMTEGIMEKMEITDLRDKAPHYLSGGQKRKVALASALVISPELLIFDEPFQGLDPRSRNEYIALINQLTEKENIATVMTLHEVELVPLLADSVYLLKTGGTISKKGTPAQVFQDYDSLKEYYLEPPVLFRLFAELKKKHPSIKIPLTIEEAVKEIGEI